MMNFFLFVLILLAALACIVSVYLLSIHLGIDKWFKNRLDL